MDINDFINMFGSNSKKDKGRKMEHKLPHQKKYLQLRIVLKRINPEINTEEFISSIEKNGFDYFVNIDFSAHKHIYLKKIIEAHNLFMDNYRHIAFIEAFSVIEQMLKTLISNQSLEKMYEIIPQAQKDEIISNAERNFLFGFKDIRNKAMHEGEVKLSEPEVRLILRMTVNIFKRIK